MILPLICFQVFFSISARFSVDGIFAKLMTFAKVMAGRNDS